MAWTPLPIGVENFEDLVTHGYYYVDKTPFIRELLDMKGKVNLFTRPRCHGPRKVRIMCPIENPESRVISAYKRVGRLLKSAHRMR